MQVGLLCGAAISFWGCIWRFITPVFCSGSSDTMFISVMKEKLCAFMQLKIILWCSCYIFRVHLAVFCVSFSIGTSDNIDTCLYEVMEKVRCFHVTYSIKFLLLLPSCNCKMYISYSLDGCYDEMSVVSHQMTDIHYTLLAAAFITLQRAVYP